MEPLEGKTLKEMVADGPLDIAVLKSVALQLVDALHAAHSKDILHRDLKPANIICDEQGNVKLLDFGLAKKMNKSPRLFRRLRYASTSSLACSA